MTPRAVLRILVLALAAAAAALLLVASRWWPSAAERAATPIVEKSVAARGGIDAWRAVKALSISGTLDAGTPRDPLRLAQAYQRALSQRRADARRAAAHAAPAAAEAQVQLPFLMELKRPRMSRVEIRFQGQTAVQVFDGTRGWKLRPYLGRREIEPFTADELRIASEQVELDGLLVDASAKHERISLVGREKVEGRDTYKLEVKAQDGLVRHVWVDAETFLDVKMEGTRRLAGKDRTVWTRFRDFRPEGDVLLPHLLETGVDGLRATERLQVEHVALNPPLPDQRFTRPD